MNKNRTIRILLLGDDKVGKTTFISTLISDINDNYQKTLKPVVLPPNMCQSSNEVFTQLIDTSPQTLNLKQQLQQANIILVFYDISQVQTRQNLQSNWLIPINQFSKDIPIIIVGNKRDKHQLEIQPQIQYQPIREVTRPLVKKYKQIQMGLQCSAYYNQDVNSVLHCAQRAVLYPLSPLYNLATRQLSEPFKRALTRIFRLLDKDMDGQLSDEQIGNLQQRVFDSELDSQDLKKIKKVINIQLQDYVVKQISLQGFISLHKKCIELLNIQICWSILRNFGYNDQLKLVLPQNKLIFKQNAGVSIQLKEKPIKFLSDIYKQFAQKYHNHQKISECLMELFIVPSIHQIPIQQFTDPNFKFELESFLIAFHYFAYTNYEQCYMTLMEIGYEGTLQQTFEITSEKISFEDMQKIYQRNVLSIGILESDNQERQYVDSFFNNSIQQNGVKRSYFIYSLPNSSKIIFLYKLNRRNLEFFFVEKRKRMLDLIVYFEKGWDLEDNFNNLEKIPSHIMTKKITQKEVDEILEIKKLSELDFARFPIVYKKSNLNKMFDLIWIIFKKPQLGYNSKTLEQLKKLNKNRWATFSGYAFLGSLAVGGIFAIKHFSKLAH